MERVLAELAVLLDEVVQDVDAGACGSGIRPTSAAIGREKNVTAKKNCSCVRWNHAAAASSRR